MNEFLLMMTLMIPARCTRVRLCRQSWHQFRSAENDTETTQDSRCHRRSRTDYACGSLNPYDSIQTYIADTASDVELQILVKQKEEDAAIEKERLDAEREALRREQEVQP